MHAASARWLGYEKWIVAGEVAIVLVSAEDSDGAFSLIELIDAPHSRDDSPLHAHPTHTQTYCTMQGIGALHIHGEDVLLHPGERYTIPPGTPHQAWNPGNTTSIVHMAMSPGGVENVYRRIGHRFEPCSFATGLAIKREQDIDEVMSIAREMGLLETPG